MGGAEKLAESATREKLLDAVGALMTERRSTDVSLSEIAAKSGVNSALVKYYFGNKAGLMLDLLRRLIGSKVREMAHLARMPLSADKKLRTHIHGIVNTYYYTPFVNRLMHRLTMEDDRYAKLIVDEFSTPVAALQRTILEQGIAEGLFKPVEPVFLYITITGSCDQFFFSPHQLRSVFGIEAVDERLRRDFADYLFRTVYAGLAPDAPAA